MLDRWVEDSLLETLHNEGIGCISFSSLAQGLLTDKYLNGIPADSRAAKASGFLQKETITPALLSKVQALQAIAQKRGQTLGQMAIVWVLKHPAMTSVILGASRVKHVDDAVDALGNRTFTADELNAIENALIA
jgi:L-glyceraldehyde 3-phosphate reductase